MSNISLLKAFLILRNGPDYVIGAGHRWKSGLLNMTIGLFLTFPILNLLYVQFYRGALPPTAPLIQSIGVFTSVYRQPSVFGGNYVANFRASDGKNHPVQLEALNSSEQLMKGIASGESFWSVLNNSFCRAPALRRWDRGNAAVKHGSQNKDAKKP
jgi:hypothetical protein